jgi:CHAT domain-containing protein
MIVRAPREAFRPYRLTLFGSLVLLFSLQGGWSSASYGATPPSPSVPPDQEMQAGMQAFRAGDFEQASSHWSLAANAYQAAGNREGQILALVQGADADLALGRYPNAFGKLQQALTLAEQAHSPSLTAAVTGSLGNAYLLAGREADAERTLRSSIDLARKANKPQVAASALNNLGNLLASQSKFDEAAGTYRQAIDTARGAGDQSLATRVSINLARALIDNAQYREASTLLSGLGTQIRALDASHDKAYGLISVGGLYTRLSTAGGEPRAEAGRQAYSALNDALDTATAIHDQRARSYALGYMGALYEQGGRYQEALDLTSQAVFAAQLVNAPELLYRWQWQTGRLLKARGEIDQAILAYQQSVHTLQTIRQDIVAGYGAHASFRETVGPVFFQLADLLLQRSGTAADPQQMRTYLVDARNTIEQLKGAELQDYFQDDCVAALRARTTGIDHLAVHTAALYPIILPDRLELLLSLPDGMKRFTTHVDATTLTKNVREFRALLEKKTTFQFVTYSQQLYKWIIGPLEPELKREDIKTLVIVPDGALRTIPMAALYDGKNYLIARYALATTPGLTLTDPRPIPRENVKIMINGLTESVQGFPPLPYVGQEIKNIHALYGGTVLENQRFTIPNMEKDLEQTPYSIVHIASHGNFSHDIDNTFLLTYDGKLNMNELQQFLGTTKYRTNAVELLTLSACETAAGDDRAALGLAGVAIKAGARSALATLWIVNDPASAELVSDFYRDLKNPSVSKAKALQAAQLALLKDPRYRHPGYWSPFLLIGNWL